MTRSTPRQWFASLSIFDAKEFKTLARIPAYIFLVLTYSGCPHDDVNTTHGGGILTDIFLYAVVIHLECEVSTLVALAVSLLYLTHVA